MEVRNKYFSLSSQYFCIREGFYTPINFCEYNLVTYKRHYFMSHATKNHNKEQDNSVGDALSRIMDIVSFNSSTKNFGTIVKLVPHCNGGGRKVITVKL